MDSDSSIRTHIIKGLGQEPTLDHSHIAVEVCQGVVRLSGQVATQVDKSYAADIAKRMAGIGSIINGLKVCPPSSGRADDEQLPGRPFTSS